MASSELGDQNSKGLSHRKPLFSERLKAIHPAIKMLGCFLLTGWLVGWLAGWQSKIY